MCFLLTTLRTRTLKLIVIVMKIIDDHNVGEEDYYGYFADQDVEANCGEQQWQ